MDQPDSTTLDQSSPHGHASPKELFNRVNLEVKSALCAAREKNSQALHLAYAKIGIALGIDKAITDIVGSYSKTVTMLREDSRNSEPARMIFHNDWGNLQSMISPCIGLKQKMFHVQQFMRRRKIPGYVVRTLHEPHDCKVARCKEVRNYTARQAANNFVKRDVFCQPKEKFTIRTSRKSNDKDWETRKRLSVSESDTRNVKSSAFDSRSRSCDKGARFHRQFLYNGKRRRIDELASHSSKQTAVNSKSSGSLSNIDRVAKKSTLWDIRVSATEVADDKKLSDKSDDKVVENCKSTLDEKSKTQNNPQSALDSKRSNTVNKTLSGVSTQEAKKSAHSGRAMEVSDGKKSSRDSESTNTVRKDLDNIKRKRNAESEAHSSRQSASHSRRSDSKDSTEKHEATKKSSLLDVPCGIKNAMSDKKSTCESDVKFSIKEVSNCKHVDEVVETKKALPDCKKNVQSTESSDCKVTKLVIGNLHPLVDDADISMIFSDFKSYKSSKVKFIDPGKLLCAAEIFFGDEADAVEAKNKFDGKKLDGLPINIVLVKDEKN